MGMLKAATSYGGKTCTTWIHEIQRVVHLAEQTINLLCKSCFMTVSKPAFISTLSCKLPSYVSITTPCSRLLHEAALSIARALITWTSSNADKSPLSLFHLQKDGFHNDSENFTARQPCLLNFKSLRTRESMEVSWKSDQIGVASQIQRWL